jgi:hypothetical protein
MLSVINYMVGAGAKEQFVEFDLKLIGDLLALEEAMVVAMVEKFMQAGCLVKAKYYDAYRLVFSDDEFAKVSDLAENQILPIKVLGKREQKPAAPVVLFPGAEPLISSTPDSSVGDLITAMKEFARHFDERTTSIMEQQAKADASLNESHTAAAKLIEEAAQLRQRNEKLEQDNRRLAATLKKEQGYYDEFQKRAQGRLEILYAEILQLLAEYGKIPKWIYNEEHSGAFQRRVVTALTNASGEIVSLTRNGD